MASKTEEVKNLRHAASELAKKHLYKEALQAKEKADEMYDYLKKSKGIFSTTKSVEHWL